MKVNPEQLAGMIKRVVPGYAGTPQTEAEMHEPLLISSIQMMNLMMHIENGFDIVIDFDEEDITQLNTFAAFVQMVEKYLGQ